MMKAIKTTAKNGGLYGENTPIAPIFLKPVYPTSTFFTSVLLEEANPPPGSN